MIARGDVVRTVFPFTDIPHMKKRHFPLRVCGTMNP